MSDETPTDDQAPEEAVPQTVAEEAPDAPADIADTTEQVVEEPIPDYITIRYDVPLDTDTPIKAAGLYWHDRSTYRLTRALAEELLTPENLARQPGFSRA